MDIFGQISPFSKEFKDTNEMTLNSLTFIHFQEHQSQKERLILRYDKSSKNANSLITKI